MSEAVQLALIDKLPSLIAGVSGMFAAYFAYRAHRIAKDTNVVARKTEENTNHLKDELVAEVRKASFAAGQKQATDKGEST